VCRSLSAWRVGVPFTERACCSLSVRVKGCVVHYHQRGIGVSITVSKGQGVCRSDFRFRVSGFRFRGSGFWLTAAGLQVSTFGFRVSGFRCGFRVSGFGFRILGFRFRVSGFRVHGAGLRVWGSGSRVQGSGSRVQGPGCGVEEPFCSTRARPPSRGFGRRGPSRRAPRVECLRISFHTMY
jgi:hypothetical protein